MRRYEVNAEWATRMHKIAAEQYYNKLWPDSEIIELDTDRQDVLKFALDVGGADMMIRFPTGGIAFLCERFRRWESRRFDDFTIRLSRPSGIMTEYGKAVDAIKRGGFVASYYAYGHVNQAEDGFIRLRILLYQKLLESLLHGGIVPAIRENPNGSSIFCAIPFRDIPDDLKLLEYVGEDR